MKAVIVEIRDKKVAALTSDGQVLIFKNNNYTIGQTVETKKLKSNMGKIVKCAASAAAAMVVCTASAWAYYTPYYYMSIDVNPSVEYSINRFDRVLCVVASNNDGEDVLKEININDMKNKRIEEAVNMLLDEVIKEGYFDEEEGGVVVAASSHSSDKSQDLTSRIKTSVEEKVKESAVKSAVDVVAVSVGEESVKAAKEIGVTPGKLELIQKLQKNAGKEENIHMEEWLNRSVKDIIKATNEYKKEEKTVGKENPDTEKNKKKPEGTDKENSSVNSNNKGNAKTEEKSKGTDTKRDNSGEVRLKDFECTVTSIDKNSNSAVVLLSNGKNMNIYFNDESDGKGTKIKNTKIDSLKENDKISVDLNYKNEKFNVKSIKIVNEDNKANAEDTKGGKENNNDKKDYKDKNVNDNKDNNSNKNKDNQENKDNNVNKNNKENKGSKGENKDSKDNNGNKDSQTNKNINDKNKENSKNGGKTWWSKGDKPR